VQKEDKKSGTNEGSMIDRWEDVKERSSDGGRGRVNQGDAAATEDNRGQHERTRYRIQTTQELGAVHLLGASDTNHPWLGQRFSSRQLQDHGGQC